MIVGWAADATPGINHEQVDNAANSNVENQRKVFKTKLFQQVHDLDDIIAGIKAENGTFNPPTTATYINTRAGGYDFIADKDSKK